MTTFYPSKNQITAITQAETAVLSLSDTNDLTLGQVVRVLVPSEYGMHQINKQEGSIVAVSSSSITLNINSSQYDPFSAPVSPLTPALIIPIGMQATLSYANSLDDATKNTTT